MSHSGKTALITGSTGGIGFAIATSMAKQNINIVLNGFGTQESIQGQINALESYGVQVLYHPADMTKPDQIKDMIETAQHKFGTIDILVNNAGMQHVCPIDSFPSEKWDTIIALNLSAAFHATQNVISGMREKGWGRIINICSAHALVASPFKSAYVAAKHGLLGFTKTIALETAKDNITCNAICPGYVFTPLVQNQIADTAKARGITEEDVINNVLLAAQWTKKFVTVEQVADLALFLCSSSAENITGADLKIDGGWTAA